MAAEALCVLCKKRPIDPVWRPFCSERCKLVDLGRWVDGSYRIPGEPVEEPGEDHGETSED
jgi:uncharacterized protein